jgi:hypothetical protein
MYVAGAVAFYVLIAVAIVYGRAAPSANRQEDPEAAQFRAATPAINLGNWRHSAARSEFESPFLNGVRHINRSSSATRQPKVDTGANLVSSKWRRRSVDPLGIKRAYDDRTAIDLPQSDTMITRFDLSP